MVTASIIFRKDGTRSTPVLTVLLSSCGGNICIPKQYNVRKDSLFSAGGGGKYYSVRKEAFVTENILLVDGRL